VVSQIERRLERGQDVRYGIFVSCDVDGRQRALDMYFGLRDCRRSARVNAGAGLPFLVVGYGVYWLVKRRRRKPE
jgi:hypothetical protein